MLLQHVLFVEGFHEIISALEELMEIKDKVANSLHRSLCNSSYIIITMHNEKCSWNNVLYL